MLLIAGILLTVLALALAVLIAFAAGMSDAPGERPSFFWPVIVALLALACFVARHWLAGRVITW